MRRGERAEQDWQWAGGPGALSPPPWTRPPFNTTVGGSSHRTLNTGLGVHFDPSSHPSVTEYLPHARRVLGMETRPLPRQVGIPASTGGHKWGRAGQGSDLQKVTQDYTGRSWSGAAPSSTVASSHVAL